MNKLQKSLIEHEAKDRAGSAAKEIAENWTITFMQQFCADLSGVRGKTYILYPATFENVYTTVSGVVFDAAFEKHFEEKLAELTKKAKHAAAEERQERKWAAEDEEWRKKHKAALAQADAKRIQPPSDENDGDDLNFLFDDQELPKAPPEQAKAAHSLLKRALYGAFASPPMIEGERVIWRGETYLIHKPLGDDHVRLVSLDGESFVDVPKSEVELEVLLP